MSRIRYIEIRCIDALYSIIYHILPTPSWSPAPSTRLSPTGEHSLPCCGAHAHNTEYRSAIFLCRYFDKSNPDISIYRNPIFRYIEMRYLNMPKSDISIYRHPIFRYAEIRYVDKWHVDIRHTDTWYIDTFHMISGTIQLPQTRTWVWRDNTRFLAATRTRMLSWPLPLAARPTWRAVGQVKVRGWERERHTVCQTRTVLQ